MDTTSPLASSETCQRFWVMRVEGGSTYLCSSFQRAILTAYEMLTVGDGPFEWTATIRVRAGSDLGPVEQDITIDISPKGECRGDSATLKIEGVDEFVDPL